MTAAKAKSARTILVVEDDEAIGEVLEHNLTREGYAVTLITDGRAGLEWAIANQPDLIVLDLMLPSMSGIDLCRRLRSDRATKDTLVLMLTARSEENDQLIGFSVGADDFVTKPFSIKILLERVRAMLNRRLTRAEENVEQIEVHGLVLDPVSHEIRINGEPLSLTPTEYRLLENLMRSPGRAFSRTELVDAAIGEDTIVLERTVDVHIRSIRYKLGEMEKIIETVRGVGYRMSRP